MNKQISISILFTFLIIIIISLYNLNGKDNINSYVPQNGFVPNEETAVKVAEAISIAIYGKEKIQEEKPLIAKLNKNGIWEVRGTLPSGYLGGTIVVRIRKSDCKVIYVNHEK